MASSVISQIEYEIIDGIKIYKGTTQETRKQYENNINYLKSLVPYENRLFTALQPSTLTAQGRMSNISFDESEIIHMLSEPTGSILMIGCNYGEKINVNYKIPKQVKRSGRGRKPKPKPKTKRRSQGSGKYFSSQITFLNKHPDTDVEYKIKLFRNGVFQVPGVKDPSMSDLIAPINVLRDYLEDNFGEDVQVLNFMAVMRNYKARLHDEKWHVDLEKLEMCINKEKSYSEFLPYINYALAPMSENRRIKCKKFIGKTNPMNIAEISYNTDRCFCLILKFYRPMPSDRDKKTTVKLLKKGKINFDGGNSELEIKELYYWLEYIYNKYRDDILVDIALIKNEYDENEINSLTTDNFIYSDGEDLSESEDADDKYGNTEDKYGNADDKYGNADSDNEHKDHMVDRVKYGTKSSNAHDDSKVISRSANIGRLILKTLRE